MLFDFLPATPTTHFVWSSNLARQRTSPSLRPTSSKPTSRWDTTTHTGSLSLTTLWYSWGFWSLPRVDFSFGDSVVESRCWVNWDQKREVLVFVWLVRHSSIRIWIHLLWSGSSVYHVSDFTNSVLDSAVLFLEREGFSDVLAVQGHSSASSYCDWDNEGHVLLHGVRAYDYSHSLAALHCCYSWRFFD